MKKIMAAGMALLMCLGMAACGNQPTPTKINTPIDINKDVLTPNLKGNYRIDFEDEEFANYVVARVNDEYFYWTNRDTTMHYYHKVSNGWDEYTKNASKEGEEYTEKAVAHHDSMDKLLEEHFKVLTHTKGIAIKKDTVPSTQTYYGLICHKYTDGDNYLFVSVDHNFIVESRRVDDGKEYFNGVIGEGKAKFGDDYKGFDDKAMVPKQFHSSVPIVIPAPTTTTAPTTKKTKKNG